MPASVLVTAEHTGSGRNSEAIYHLSVSSGPGGAAFGLAYKLPAWPTPGLVNGSPMRIVAANFSGPGMLRPATSPPVPKPRLKRPEVCRREGPSPFATAFWIELPGNSAAELELRARGTYPSWPHTDYSLSFSTFETDTPYAIRTPLETVSFPFLGLRGDHIIMGARHGTKTHESDRRATPVVVGRTDPPLRSARIVLRAIRVTIQGGVALSQWNKRAPASVALGSVRTNGRGQFVLPSQPFPYAGRYAFLARSEAHGRVAADWNCGPFF